jgi:hypothetical protein
MDEGNSSLKCVSKLSVVDQNAKLYALDYNEQHPAGDPGYGGSSDPARLLPGMLELSRARKG